MSAEQVVIGVRHFQVDIFSVPERRKKRDKDETLAIRYISSFLNV